LDIETVSMNFGDVELRCGGRGRPLVVLHRDTGGNGWTDFHRALAEDHLVIAPSLPGFDGSTLPAWLRDPIHLAIMAGQIVDQLDVELPCAMVGLGFGGWLAALLATMGHDRISDLVLVSPMGLKPAAGEVVDQFLFTAPAYVRMGFADASVYDRMFAGNSGQPSEAVQAGWDRARETMTRIAWKPIGYDPQLPLLLAGVRAPSLVVWGDEDRIVPPSCAAQWATALPDCEMMTLGGGHQLELGMPEKLAGLIGNFVAGAVSAQWGRGDTAPTPN
jgi:pimeloyl-ACP methyl ester carboxylesterase